MGTMQESSVLFSLKQLQSLEETRVREEEEAAKARALAEKRAAEEAERRIAEELSAKKRIEAERAAREEAERRAEEARIEAIRVAAVERAKAEAEVAARVEAMRIAEEHERALAALGADQQKQRLGRAVKLGVAGSIVVFAAALGLYFGKIKPEAEARLRAQQADIAATDEEAERLRKEVAQRDARIREAERALAAANEQSAKSRAPTEGPKDEKQRNVAPVKKDKPSGGCTCLEGDPLCGCIR